MADAQRALRIVKHLLDFLNQQGAGLTLPSVLRFWTPDVPNPVAKATSSEVAAHNADA